MPFGSIFVDIIIILIFIFSILHAYKRGLTLVIYQFVSLIITFIALLILCKPVTNWVTTNTNLDEFFSNKIQTTLGKSFEDNFNNGTLIESKDTNISNSVVNIINNYISEAKEKSENNVAEFVSNEISYIVVSAIVIIILYIVIRILTIFLKYFLTAIASLPIISTFDKSGGIIYGIIRGFLIIYILLAILSLLSPILAETGIVSIIKSSKICSIFYNNNILLKIFE